MEHAGHPGTHRIPRPDTPHVGVASAPRPQDPRPHGDALHVPGVQNPLPRLRVHVRARGGQPRPRDPGVGVRLGGIEAAACDGASLLGDVGCDVRVGDAETRGFLPRGGAGVRFHGLQEVSHRLHLAETDRRTDSSGEVSSPVCTVWPSGKALGW